MILYIVLGVLVFTTTLSFLKIILQDPITALPAERKSLGKQILEAISPFLKINKNMTTGLRKKLDKLGTGQTPEEYWTAFLLKAITCLAAAVFFLLNGNRLIAFVMIVLIFAIWKAQEEKLANKLEQTEYKIIEELPEFMSYVTNSLKFDKDITVIIENYLIAANLTLRTELEKLLADLKTGNIDEALFAFDLRLGIPHLSSYIYTMRSALRGEIQYSTLEVITNDMEKYEHEAAARRADEIPEKVKRASIAMMVSTIAFLIIIVCYSLVISFKYFN